MPKSKRKQKLKQDDGTAQREALEMEQKDAKIARLEQELAETKQQKDVETAQLKQELAETKQQKDVETAQLKQELAETKQQKDVENAQLKQELAETKQQVADLLKQPEEQETKEQLEKSVGGVGPLGKEIKVSDSEFKAKRSEMRGAKGTQHNSSSLDEIGEARSRLEQSIVVENLCWICNEISGLKDWSIIEGLEKSPDQTGRHRTSSIQILPQVSHATPVVEEVQPKSEFALPILGLVLQSLTKREFVLRELAKVGKNALEPFDMNIVNKLREDEDVKLIPPIRNHDLWTTVRSICFLILTKPSQSDFDLMAYRKKHYFRHFENGSDDHDFYSKILRGEGDDWLKKLEETAQRLGTLELQYFKLCLLIAQVNHEAHPVLILEHLIAYIEQHGFSCRGVDLTTIVKHVANWLMAKK